MPESKIDNQYLLGKIAAYGGTDDFSERERLLREIQEMLACKHTNVRVGGIHSSADEPLDFTHYECADCGAILEND